MRVLPGLATSALAGAVVTVPWAVVFAVNGMWALDATHRGYHSVSSDTTYLDLRTLMICVGGLALVIGASLLRAGPRTQRFALVAVVTFDTALWSHVAASRFGFARSGSFSVASGTFYLAGFVLGGFVAAAVGAMVARR